MNRARAAAALLSLGVVAWLVAPSSAAPGPFSFPHKPHLSAAAMKGADADCRVCHDYAKGAREAHLAGCDQCHVDGKHLEKKVTGAYARPAFQHKEHLFDAAGKARTDLNCFTCHAMRVDSDWIEFSVPTAGLGPKSAAGAPTKTCADCHASHETAGGLVKQDEKTGDGQACAVCHLNETSILPLRYRGDQRPSARKPFLHKDHGGPTGDCASCHAEIAKSKTIWDYDPTAGVAEKCAGCHVDAAGKPLVAPGASTSVAKIDFSNFPHAKHLGAFTAMKCATCHFPATDVTGAKYFPKSPASPEPVGRAQLLRFAACDACHGQDGWSPGKPDWHVEGHGVGAWACFKCHEGAAKDGKLPIATAVVDDRPSWTFRITDHRHPGVTRDGPALADARQKVGGATKACADCHVGDVATLASRLREKPFAHGPHLPAAPTSEACLVCHADAGVARRSEDFTPVAEKIDCARCHGAMDEARTGGGSRRVTQFDHAGHVKSASLLDGAKGVGCTECHTVGGPRGYETPADVLSCTKCHAHDGDAAKVARTGPKTSAGDSTKCLFCHDAVRGSAGGVVNAPPRETIERRHLALTPGVQRHDKTGDCAACHVREGAAATPYEERIRSAKIALSIHDDPAFADRPFNDPKGNCATCHREPPRGYLRSLSKR